MEITISQNIRALRKQRKMTQEQLAEALGVTVGAVHKWESKASMPEIRLLIEMADLFCVSVDVLLGYEIKSSGAEDIIDRIKAHVRTKTFDAAIAEAEKALIRYPNTFRIVSCCADAYERKGLETGDKDAVRRAIELMERSIPLLSQNDDPQISEVTIRSDIAVCCLVLGQTDRSIDILKKYNAGGINNSLLGLIHAQTDPAEAEKYLTKGLSDVVTHSIRCMSGYVNYFLQKNDMIGALEAAQWLIQFLESLKADTEAICYFDKIIASFQAVSAAALFHLGRQQEAEKLLLAAYRKAVAFDAEPNYGAYAIKFCIDDAWETTASDDLGESVMEAIENMLRSEEFCIPALEKWEELKKKYPAESKEESSNG